MSHLNNLSSRDHEFYNYVLSTLSNKPDHKVDHFVDHKEITEFKDFLFKLCTFTRNDISLVWPSKDDQNIVNEINGYWRDSHHGINPIYFLMSVDVITRRDICQYLGFKTYKPESKANKVFKFIHWIACSMSYGFIGEVFGVNSHKAHDVIMGKAKDNIIIYYFALPTTDQNKLIDKYNTF